MPFFTVDGQEPLESAGATVTLAESALDEAHALVQLETFATDRHTFELPHTLSRNTSTVGPVHVALAEPHMHVHVPWEMGFACPSYTSAMY